MGTNLSFSSTYQPKTNVQTEVVNRSLGNILRILVYEHSKQWDLALAHAKFTYNDSPNRSTSMIPFQIVYGMHPRGVYELRYLGKQEKRSAEGEYFAIIMDELQDNIKKILHESPKKYKQG